jgi:hypothetical protein
MPKEQTPQETSNLFHSIMKARVSKPQKEIAKQDKTKVNPKPKK